MYESLYPTDDMWDKFEFSSEYPPISVPTYDEEYEEEAVDLTNYLLRHDCMLSGTCRNEAHREDCCNVETETVVAVSLSVRPIKSGRSVLRTSRLRLRSVSPRPETPSESEEEEEYIASEIEIEGVCDEDFDEFDDEVTDQDTDRINSEVTYDESYSSSSAYSSPDHAAYSSPNHAAYSSPGHAAYSSPDHAAAFHSDHCYHLNKTAVVLDNLGVQTPSDSGE
ncbi:hypothetical protein C0J52_11275 [Blattella germanica]|nr:hypothetical protein C0J52_11275 [Blattella germanica]